MSRLSADDAEQYRPAFQDARRDLFLAALARSSCVRLACRASKVPTSTAYHWRQTDGDFRRAWDEALGDGLNQLEQDLVRRFRRGVKRKVFHAGKVVGMQTEYQDALALKLLAMHRQAPERGEDEVQEKLDRNGSFPRTSLDDKIDALRRQMEQANEEEERARRDRLSGF